VQGRGVFGIGLKNLAINIFGLRSITGFMELDGKIQGLGNFRRLQILR